MCNLPYCNYPAIAVYYNHEREVNTMRDFDTINEIMSNLDDATYKLTQTASENFYAYGDKSLLCVASEKSGLTPEEILMMW